MNEAFVRSFFSTLAILRSYLPQFVVAGGWAPFLYYRYYVKDRTHIPILTSDMDLMVNQNVSIVGSKTIDQLLTEAQFSTAFKTKDTPPIIHYEGAIEGVAVEIEFLTDQTGSRPDVVLEVQKGLHAEALRYVSILVENVLQLTVDDEAWIASSSPLIVQVPSPAAYIFQKGLAFTRRRDKTKAAKDLYYLFDILAGIPQIRDEILADFDVFSKTHPKWFRTFTGNLEKYFASINAEGTLGVFAQRPAGVFPGLEGNQFRQFAFRTFEEFIHQLRSIT
jgi:predicted nucleotidyltransferase